MNEIQNILIDVKKRLNNKDFVFKINGQNIENMWRHPMLINLIKYYSSIKKDVKLLEIGSFLGSSIYAFAQSVQKYLDSITIYSVDPLKNFVENSKEKGEGQVDTISELCSYDYAYNIFLHNVDLIEKKFNKVKIIHLRNYSNEILPILNNEFFDIVYIDGSHIYKQVLFDIQESKRLVKNNGIICGDDLEICYRQCDSNYLKKNLSKDYVQDPKTKKYYHPGVTLAVYEQFREVSNYYGFWCAKKENDTFSKISLDLSQIYLPSHILPNDAIFDFIGVPDMRPIFENFIKKIDNFKIKSKLYKKDKNIIQKLRTKGVILDENINNSIIFTYKDLNEIKDYMQKNKNSDIYYLHSNFNLYKINFKLLEDV